MVGPKSARHTWGTALAAALVYTAAAHAADFTSRMQEAQELRAHDRFTQARTLYQSILADVRKEGKHPLLEALVLDSLAINEQESGQYAAAETAFNHGLAALSAEPADNSLLIDIKTHLSELYIAETRAHDAEEILRQARAAVRRSTAPNSDAQSVLNEDLAVACIMQKKFDEPEALLRESQALIEKTFGPEDPRLTSSLLTYAGLLIEQHHYSDAVAPAEHAWELLTHSPLQVPKPYEASAASVLGAVYYHAGKIARAQEYARRSVDLAEASLGPTHPRLGLYLSNYATILRVAGHKNEAKVIQKQADEIREQCPSSLTGGYTVNVASLGDGRSIP